MFEFSLFLFMIVYTFKSTICLQYGGGGGGSSYAKSSGPISAAIKSHYNLEVRNVQLENEPIPEPKIDIESRQIPMVLHFKTQSSKLKIMQTHIGNPGETKRTKSEDEPSVLIHEVRKPVFQQVREIIVPYRKTVQEVKPVQEQVETIVSRGQGGGYGVVKPIYSPKQMPIYKPIPMYSNIPKYPSPPKHQYLYDNGDIDLKSALESENTKQILSSLNQDQPMTILSNNNNNNNNINYFDMDEALASDASTTNRSTISVSNDQRRRNDNINWSL